MGNVGPGVVCAVLCSEYVQGKDTGREEEGLEDAHLGLFAGI